MELFFRKYFRWLHHKSHTLRRKVFHNQAIKEFFASKNARLAVILIIAAAIPLTVLALQQIQDIRQQAAGETCENITNACSGEYIATPLCAPKGTKIVFTKADGDAFDFEKYGFGNGAKNCTDGGTSITCDAVGTGGKTKPVTHHSMSKNGVDVCKYGVEWKESDKPKPPKNPAPGKGTPGHTPVPTATPKQNEGCEGNLTANSCTADKKPRLSVTWNIKGGSTCSVKVGGVEISKDCSAANKVITDLNGKALESDKSYDLVISNGSTCKDKKADTETTAKCSSSSTATPTKKPGTTGPTPTPSKLGPPDGESIKASCKGTQSAPKITVSWNKVTLAKKYIANLRTSQGGSVVKTETTENFSATLEGIRKDQKYFYSVISVDATGKKSEESKVASDRTITCTNSNLQTPGSAGAESIENPNATPTKVFALPPQP